MPENVSNETLQILLDRIESFKKETQQPVSGGYGDAAKTTEHDAPGSETVKVVLPFACLVSGKWLNWTEEYLIQDGDAAFNALIDKILAKKKPLQLKKSENYSGGSGYGKR